MERPNQEISNYYATLNLAEKKSEKYLKNIAKVFGGKMFPLGGLLGTMSGGSDFITIDYDGGRHPEYNSNAFSEVYGFSVNGNGKLVFSIEDADEYEVNRANADEIINIAETADNCIIFAAEELLRLLCPMSFKHNRRYMLVSGHDFRMMRKMTLDDVNAQFDKTSNGDYDSFEQFCQIFSPLEMIELLSKIAKPFGKSDYYWSLK